MAVKITEIILSTPQLCALLEVDRSTLTRWHQNGAPGRTARGKWDIMQFFPWWCDNIFKDPQENKRITDSKERYWAAKADRERFRADAERGEYLPKSKIIPEWAGRMGEVTAGLVALSDRIPPLIEGKTREEAREIIAREVWALRDNYCRSGVFCPPVEKSVK